ncbi:hypothetical protein FNH09_13830 [Streptomyces adustus]|uniref:Uncharacterized protein n=1 Tax=Streptomyces adustus TaxID=1609272 RepID=A0A5N8VBM0_9ACTN|nr:hypothetical protein [Streptomyces adustus]
MADSSKARTHDNPRLEYLAAASHWQITRAMKRGLEWIRCRPDLVDGRLATAEPPSSRTAER